MNRTQQTGTGALILLAVALLPMSCARPTKQTADELKARKQALREPLQIYKDWTEKTFASLLRSDQIARMTGDSRDEFERKCLDSASSKANKEYYFAICALGDLRSKQAVKPLLALAADERERDNRDRWMAVRALGMIGDKSVTPQLIHLVYHYNMNTRFWAQISLFELTGQGFGVDLKAWAEWYNKTHPKGARCSTRKIKWTSNTEWGDPAVQRESDRKFIESRRPEGKQK